MKKYKKESDFQADLRKKLELRFPGSIVTKQDPNDTQGIPDLAIFYNGKYAWLECKLSEDAEHQPNQDDYIQHAKDDGAFAEFIWPENEEVVLNDLERSFEV